MSYVILPKTTSVVDQAPSNTGSTDTNSSGQSTQVSRIPGPKGDPGPQGPRGPAGPRDLRDRQGTLHSFSSEISVRGARVDSTGIDLGQIDVREYFDQFNIIDPTTDDCHDALAAADAAAAGRTLRIVGTVNLDTDLNVTASLEWARGAKLTGNGVLTVGRASVSVLHARDFGAVWDGVTDDTVALNRMIATVNASGARGVVPTRGFILQLPSGAGYLPSGLNPILVDGVYWRGHGKIATTVYTRSGVLFDFGYNGSGANNAGGVADMSVRVVVTPVAITGITQDNPAVVTAAGHGRSNGDLVRIRKVSGMLEVNNQDYTVANATSTTFELSGVDSSAFAAYSSGGFVEQPPSHDQTVMRIRHTDRMILRNIEVDNVRTLLEMAPTSGKHCNNTVIEDVIGNVYNSGYATISRPDTGGQTAGLYVDARLNVNNVPATRERGLAITAITQANPAVVTSAGHALTNGMPIRIKNVAGMTELNGNDYVVANVTTDTYELDGVDSTGFGAYASDGTAHELHQALPGTDFLHFAGSHDTLQLSNRTIINRYYRGIYYESGSGVILNNTIIVGAWFDYCQTALKLEASAGVIATFYFVNGWLYSSDGPTIDLTRTNPGSMAGIYIRGNTVRMAGLENIVIPGASSDVHFDDNTIFSAGRLAGLADQVSAVRCGNVDADRFFIRNNQWIDATLNYGAAGFHLAYTCVNLSNITSQRYEVSGNYARASNVYYNIIAGATGTRRHIVRGNRRSDDALPEYMTNGTIAIGASPYTYTNYNPWTEFWTIRGGTVSAVAINGQSHGATNPFFLVLTPGESFTVTYSSAPTITYSRRD